jgi:hypothetical protein
LNRKNNNIFNTAVLHSIPTYFRSSETWEKMSKDGKSKINLQTVKNGVEKNGHMNFSFENNVIDGSSRLLSEHMNSFENNV